MAKRSDSEIWLEGAIRREISADAVREQLERILKNPDFTSSNRRRKFLLFVVNETLAGRGDRLKGFTVAVEAFDRDETFDPQSDPVVRLEARRLRRELERYYLSDGKDDPIRINIPKGAYKPTFETSKTSQELDDRSDIERFGAPRPRTPEKSSWKNLVATLAIFAVLAAGLGVWWFEIRSSPTGPPIGRPSLAVIPFVNSSGKPEQNYLAEGFVSELINGLLKFNHLVVISRGVSSSYTGREYDYLETGKKLSADYVLIGNIQKIREKLHVGAELISVKSANVIWSGNYDRMLSSGDVLEVRKAISEIVTRKLAEPYGVVYRESVSNQTSKPPSDFTSYDCVLRLYDYSTDRTSQKHGHVRSCLEQAVERNPNYAEAWAGLAIIYLDEVRDGFNPRHGSYNPLDRAIEAAKRATRLAPESASAHRALYVAHFIRNELPEFLAAVERALILNANDVDVIADAGFKLAISGRWSRGITLLDKAVAMSPAHLTSWHFAYALNEYRQRSYERALAETLKIDMNGYYMTHVFLAMSYGLLGRAEDAQIAIDRIAELKPDFSSTVRQNFRQRNVPDALIEHIINGLENAGMKITDRQT